MTDKLQHQLRLCAHIMAEGRRCQSPALRQFDYCRHHRRYHNDAPLPDYARPALRDPVQVQRAILRGVHEMLNGDLDFRSFNQMVNLYARSLPARPKQRASSSSRVPVSRAASFPVAEPID